MILAVRCNVLVFGEYDGAAERAGCRRQRKRDSPAVSGAVPAGAGTVIASGRFGRGGSVGPRGVVSDEQPGKSLEGGRELASLGGVGVPRTRLSRIGGPSVRNASLRDPSVRITTLAARLIDTALW